MSAGMAMAIEDEEVKKPVTASVPRRLDGLSVEELEAWIGALKLEIARTEAELARRRDVRGAAEALFKKPAGG